MRNSSHRDSRWYPEDTPEEEMPNRVYTTVEDISVRNSLRKERILDANALYGDVSSFAGLYGAVDLTSRNDELSHNIIAPAIDTLAAEVTQSRVRPMCITKGGDGKQQKHAKIITRAIDAQWDLDDIDSLVHSVVLDSAISGCGIARVFRHNEMDASNDRVGVERLFPGNVIMDDRFCIDTRPREFYVHRTVDRAHLASMYPDKAEEIWQVENSERHHGLSIPDSEANVELLEAFHLPSTPGANDGRRVLCTRNSVLLDKSLDRRTTDYVFLRGIPSRMGWWGDSLVMRAAPAQLELNFLCYTMQVGHHLVTTPKVFVERQSGIVKAHLTDDIGDVIEYDGQPPIFYTPQAFHAEFYGHVERLTRWVFDELGISELSAISKKPAGLDSGAAIRMFSDIQTRRWINYVRRVERFCEDIANLICIKNKEIAEENPSHSVSVFMKRSKRYDSIKWKDIQMDEDKYVMRIYSASALPNTPAGKLQALEELVKVGAIDQKTFIKMADIPDFESVRDLLVAGEELMQESFQELLDNPSFSYEPDPMLDLKAGRAMATNMVHKAALDGYEDSDIRRLIEWIDASYEVEDRIKEEEMQKQALMQKRAMDAAMAQAQPQMPGAPGAGMPSFPQQAGMPSQATPPAPFDNIPTE